MLKPTANKTNKHHSLLTKLTISIIIVSTIILSFCGYIFYQQDKASMNEKLQKEQTWLLNNLADSLSESIFNYSQETIHKICKTAMKHKIIIAISIDMKDGNIINYSRNPQGQIVQSPANNQQRNIQISTIKIKNNDIELAILKLTITRKYYEQTLQTILFKNILTILILEFTLAIALIYTLHICFIKPLKQLIIASTNIANGNLNTEIPNLNTSELNQLAKSYNIMKHNITEKINALQHEADIEKKAEQRLHTIIDSLPIGVIIVDSETRKITYANPHTLKNTGTTLQELQKKQCFQLLCKTRNKPCPLENIKQYSDYRENIITNQKGDIIPILKTVRKITFNNRPHLIESFINISTLKETEQKLNNLRNYLTNIINSMPSILIGVTSTGIITQWNSKAEKHYNIRIKDAIGKPIETIIPRLKKDLKLIKLAIEEKQEQCDCRRCYYHNKKKYYENLTIFPLLEGEEQGAVIRIDDINEQVRIEELIIQNEKMLSVGSLAKGVAHELNNPLSGIIQTTEIINNRLLKTDISANIRTAEILGINMQNISKYIHERKIDKLLKNITKSSKHATKIITNMLAFVRKSNDSKTSNHINKIIDKSLELAQVDYNLKKYCNFQQIEINKEYQTDIPPIICSENKIQQAIINILRNGAEAMAKAKCKHPQFIIRIIHQKNQETVKIEIEDNGTGMNEETCKRIFEPFFTTKSSKQGFGLGLSVSYFIITENHNGTITATSELGKGSIFTIQLPTNQPTNKLTTKP